MKTIPPNIIAFLICCLLSTVKSYAQSEGFLSIANVPGIVQEKFKLLYPEQDIARAAWEYENGGYEAYIKDKKGTTGDVMFFNTEGKLEYHIFTEGSIRTGTEREINAEALPEAIRIHLSGTYNGKIIRASVVKFDLEEKTKGYRVMLEDIQLLYDSEGRLQKQ